MKKKILAILVTTLLLPVATFAASLSYTYVQALDTFLNRLETYQNNSNYIYILDSFSEQIKGLRSSYSSSGNVPLMIDYLIAGVADLKARKLASNTNDDFFTNLENIVSGLTSSSGGNGTSSTSTSGGSTSSTSSSGGNNVGTSTSSTSSSGGATSSTSSTSSGGGSTSSTSSSGGSSTSSTSSSGGSDCRGIYHNGVCITSNLHWVYATNWSTTCEGSGMLGTQTRTIRSDRACYWDADGVVAYGEETANGFPASSIAFGSNICNQVQTAYLPTNTSRNCLNTNYVKTANGNYASANHNYSEAVAFCGNGWRLPTMNEAANFFTYGGLTTFRMNPGGIWTSELGSYSGSHRLRYSSGGYNDFADTMKASVVCIRDANATNPPTTSSSGGSSTPSVTYSWNTGSFGACSATCGGGTQTRTVQCRSSDGVTVADSNCTGTKPATSQTCNPQACGATGIVTNSVCTQAKANIINNIYNSVFGRAATEDIAGRQWWCDNAYTTASSVACEILRSATGSDLPKANAAKASYGCN